jgi:hypothetical protein
METRKLTVTEIELRILKFKERSETLSGVLSDVTSDVTKISLQKQINRYRSLLRELNIELEGRMKQTSN